MWAHGEQPSPIVVHLDCWLHLDDSKLSWAFKTLTYPLKALSGVWHVSFYRPSICLLGLLPHTVIKLSTQTITRTQHGLPDNTSHTLGWLGVMKSMQTSLWDRPYAHRRTHPWQTYKSPAWNEVEAEAVNTNKFSSFGTIVSPLTLRKWKEIREWTLTQMSTLTVIEIKRSRKMGQKGDPRFSIMATCRVWMKKIRL